MGRGENEELLNEYIVSVLQEKCLEICFTTMCMYLTLLNYTIKIVKIVYFMLCVFYHKKERKLIFYNITLLPLPSDFQNPG